ncbi:G-patch domain-containing protein [Verticillium dahliae]
MPRPGFRGGGRRGSSRGGAGRNPSSRGLADAQSYATEPSYIRTVFSLADEARSTAHGHTPWSAGTRLRNQPVNFVSAGAVDPLKQLEDQLQRLERELQSKANDALDGLSRQAPTSMLDVTSQQADIVSDHMTPMVVQGPAFDNPSASPWEGLGSTSNHAEEDFASQHSRPASPIFNSTAPNDNPASAEASQVAVVPTEPPSSPLLFFIDTNGDPSHRHQRSVPEDTHQLSTLESSGDSSEEVILFRGRNKMGPKSRQIVPQKPNRPHAKQQKKAFDLRDIQKEVHQLVTDADIRGPSAVGTQALSPNLPSKNREKRQKHKVRANGNLRQAEDASKEQEAILADYIANMRENGDDLGLITSQGHAKRDIGGSDMDMHVENDLQSAQNDDKSGLSGDAASLAGSSKSVGDLDALDYESKQREPHTRLTDSDFLLAQMFAAGEATDAYSSQDDEYDDLDFMEWGDPITKRTRKPKKGKLPVFNVSDSELEAVLLSTYNNDRLKKAGRKKEREKLRAQGLLGKKGKPEDLRIKYPQGMGIEQIAQELESFLKNTDHFELKSLALPPMDNHARKVLHELANKFNIKSKSTGSGDQRRPTLYRTARTLQYSADNFDQAIGRVGRKYFPRKDLGSRWSGVRGSVRRGGGGQPDTGYRDGEVVGGSAPELGQENRGRAMLEKMGWSTGTALGSMDNKGILQPVEQKVKRGKAGLG